MPRRPACPLDAYDTHGGLVLGLRLFTALLLTQTPN